MRIDAIVIGGGVGGLVASLYLRRAGRSVLLLEAQDTLGGVCRAIPSLNIATGAATLSAIDPRMIDELDLLNKGLTFAIRDMPLAIPWPSGKTLLLGRDPHQAAQAIAVYSAADAQNYKRYRRELFALARALRPWWWEDAPGPLEPRNSRALLDRLEATSAAAYLNGWFETDALKVALAFDSVAPFEPGSALALVWRAAQEMCGLQGAVAVPKGGPAAFASILIALAKASGVEIRTGARVVRLSVDGDAVQGVELDSGERVASRCVLSSLSRRATLLDLAPTASAGFAETQRLIRSAPHTAEAHITLLLDESPALCGMPANARTVIAERLDVWLDIDSSAHQGLLPDELMMEVVVPTAIEPDLAPPGQHALSVTVRGLPAVPQEGWAALSARLAEPVVNTLERHMRSLRAHITGIHFGLPDQIARDAEFSVSRALSPYHARIVTPVNGLFLCGSSAEPMDAVSGRAGRLAAEMAHTWLSPEVAP